MCLWLSGEQPAKCHCMFPPNHIVKVGGEPVSKATGVSFFASGPFPTCYQMSRSSTTEASKSSSLGAATGAANVRKPNTEARSGRFQVVRNTDGGTDTLFSAWLSKISKYSLSTPNSSWFYPTDLFSWTSTSADGSAPNPHFTFWDFWKVCVKFTW